MKYTYHLLEFLENVDFTLLSAFVKPGFKFFQFYVLKGGFLDGFVGFVVAALSGYSVLLRYIQLWSLRRLSK